MAIGGPLGENNPCYLCGGTGLIDGEFHYACLGTGLKAGLELNVYLKDMRDEIDVINESFTELKTWCQTVNQKLAYLKEKIDAL